MTTLRRRRASGPLPLILSLIPLLTACTRPPLTVAERSGFRETAAADQVEDFIRQLDRQAPLITTTSLGTSAEGRPIPLLILADPPVTPEATRPPDQRMVILMFGNIHAGEVCGKEALLMLARDLALQHPHHRVLDNFILCFAPLYNIDGNERFGPDNRPGQVGPDRMGTRANAQGLDLNRDYVKLDAPESRALVDFLNRWDPAIIVDTHTTNGSHHRYVLTYQGPKHPAGDPRVIELVRERMLPAIGRAFEAQTGWNAFFYGNFADDHTRWTTYPAEPRYGVAYRGMRNRLSILTEAYAYAPYEDRVRATFAFCNEILDWAAANASIIRTVIRSADDAQPLLAQQGAPVVLRTQAVPFTDPVTVLGYEEYDDQGRLPEPGAPRDYTVAFVNDFAPLESVSRPLAYAIPASLESVVDHLELHGVQVVRLDEPLDVSVERSRVLDLTHTATPYGGRRRVEEITVSSRPGEETLPADTWIVRLDQPLGTLAAYLLEPRATDGLTAWGFLDDHLAPGEDYPILRIRSDVFSELNRRDQAARAQDQSHAGMPTSRSPSNDRR
ncbi:MAG: M14 family metallopeptidase [Phycisphaerales bacterium]|nr:M14 family metallopeptidase [Phycisphaerales bacterium]